MRRRRPSWLQVRSAGAQLAVALVVGSVLWALTRDGWGNWLLLSPERVRAHGAFWEPFTYAFVAGNEIGVIFGALILWSIGTALESSWGRRRVLVLTLGCTWAAGLLTVGLSFLFPSLLAFPYWGGTVMSTVVWVAYGLALGQGRANFWGVLPVTGNVLALIGAGFVLLSAVFSSPRAVIPDLISLVLVTGYMRRGAFRMLVLRFQSWRFRREMRARSAHLRVIAKDRNTDGGSDHYLH